MKHPVFLPAMIVLVAAMAYAVGGELGFYEDDWAHVARASSSWTEFQVMLEEWLLSQRPMNGPVLAVLAATVRLAGLWVGHVLLLLPHVAAAVLVYLLLLELGAQRETVAFPAALLWLFYPADSTATVWFFGAIYSCAVFFALLSVLLFIRARGRPAMVAGSCLAYAASVTSVEINALVVPALLIGWWLLNHDDGWRPKMLARLTVALLPLFVIAVSHAGWWYWLVPRYGVQRKINTFTFDLGDLVSNVGHGVLFSAAFPYPIYAKINAALSAGRAETVVADSVFCAAIVAVALGAVFGVKRAGVPGSVASMSARRIAVVAGLGLAVVVVAYLPWCLGNGRPGYFSFRGRANYAPAVGVAIIYASALMLLSQWKWWAERGYWLAVVPLWGAMVFQLTARREFAEGWAHQRALFSGIVRRCPELAPDTAVIVDGLGEVRWKRGDYIVSGGWSVAGALRILYGRKVAANVFRRDPGWTSGRPEYSDDGVYLHGRSMPSSLTPYGRVLLLLYRRPSRTLQVPERYAMTDVDARSVDVEQDLDHNCRCRSGGDCRAEDMARSTRAYLLDLMAPGGDAR